MAACNASQECDSAPVPQSFEIAVPFDRYRALVAGSAELTETTCRALCKLGDMAAECKVLSDLGDSGQLDTGEEAATYVLVACTEWQERPCG